MKLYQLLASQQEALLRSVDLRDDSRLYKCAETIVTLCREHLPSGAGIDNGCSFDTENSTGEKLIIESSFHRMNSQGMYCGWLDFRVEVTPSLINDFNLKITGPGSWKRHDLADYLAQTFDEALRKDVSLNG
jgi:hypothetical protein